MRFWLCVSVVLFMRGVSAYGQNQSRIARSDTTRRNEWKLAGLLPGHTILARAEEVLGPSTERSSSGESAVWRDCFGNELNVDLDKKSTVTSIRISRNYDQRRPSDCTSAVKSTKAWVTGAGLRLSESVGRVVALYGEPTSRSPSTKNGQPLELLYYAFDWAGPDVPQVMEVVCTVPKDGTPGRVVELTLAAGSL